MSKTIKLIGKHNWEFEEYMKKNGKWSFHRFSDGSIHYLAPVFNDLTRIVDTCPTPVAPVKELEKLEKATMVEDALVTINNFVKFDGSEAILGDTEIRFYGVGVAVEYTGIHSLIIDFNHDLKKIIQKIKKGNFGQFVVIDGIVTKSRDIEVFDLGINAPVPGKDWKMFMLYDNVEKITDEDGHVIYWGSAR